MDITIGSNPSNDIVITDSRVSEHHATISMNSGCYAITDQSTNGTLVGGILIHNQTITVALFTPVLLAENIPLDWNRVKELLDSSIKTPTPPPINNTQVCYKLRHDNNNNSWEYEDPRRNEGIGALGILCFFWWILGVILYFVWINKYPRKARQALYISLSPVIILILLYYLT